MATNNHLQTLFQNYMNNTCTKEEWEELLQLVREETHEDDLIKAFQSYWDQLQTTESNAGYWNNKFQRMMEEAKTITTPVVQMKPRTRWIKWIAAASVIIIATLAVVGVFTSNQSDVTKPVVAKTNDVPAPSNTRAVITLADGTKVYLDSANNGTLAKQDGVEVVRNNNGEISYLSANSQQLTANSPVFNTLFNPRGSKVISLTLSDGTKVWLNSESSLRYPASFAAAAVREVEITGEVYFEVKHDAKQPFKVHLPNGSIIEDIGTAFNVNAYADEEAIKTTLVEGAVQIFASSANTSASSAFKLKPGEQSVISRTSPAHQITKSPDIDEVLAWKNGQFNLRSTDLAVLMRQVARWYDVDVVFEGTIPQNKFGGSLSRELSLSTLLKALKESGINVELKDRKIIIR